MFKLNVLFQEGEMKKQLTDVNQQYSQIKEDHQVRFIIFNYLSI
jgi:hypothetical protein